MSEPQENVATPNCRTCGQAMKVFDRGMWYCYTCQKGLYAPTPPKAPSSEPMKYARLVEIENHFRQALDNGTLVSDEMVQELIDEVRRARMWDRYLNPLRFKIKLGFSEWWKKLTIPERTTQLFKDGDTVIGLQVDRAGHNMRVERDEPDNPRSITTYIPLRFLEEVEGSDALRKS